MALNITDHVRFVILTPVLALFKVCKKFEGYSNQKAYDTNFASGTGYERYTSRSECWHSSVAYDLFAFCIKHGRKNVA